MPTIPPVQYSYSARSYQPPSGAGELDIGFAFSAAWRIMKDNYGILLGAPLLCGLLNFAVGLVASFVPFFGPIGSLFFTAPLNAGLLFLSVKAARGQHPGVGDLFLGFKRYWPIMGIFGIKYAAMLVAIAPIAMVVGIAVAMGVVSQNMIPVGILIAGVFLSAIALIFLYVYVRFSLAEQLGLDERVENPGVIESLKTSWQLTQPVAWSMVGVVILMAIISALCMLLLVLPAILLAMPLNFALVGAMYAIIVIPRPPRRCEWCGCDLTGIRHGICPACGAPVTTAAAG